MKHHIMRNHVIGHQVSQEINITPDRTQGEKQTLKMKSKPVLVVGNNFS